MDQAALKQAVKWRMLPQNPAQFVDLPKVFRKEMKALSPTKPGHLFALPFRTNGASAWGTPA